MTKILVIEDDTLIREEIIDCLIFEGYDAIQAESGRLGIEYASTQTPDLILCDLMMPDLDGYDVLRHLHAQPATVSIPFIVITAFSGLEFIRKAKDLGADAYLEKPFSRLQLLEVLQIKK